VEQRGIGGSDVYLSVVGLGGAWLGDDPEDASEVSRAREVVQAAAEAGMNWLDTSENYFDSRNEAVIGLILGQFSPESFRVCTKLAPGAAISGGGSGFRPEQVRRGCHESLRRLGRDRLDAYLLHWPDEGGVPLEETWGAMASLVDDGLVGAIGLSNYSQEDIASCHAQRRVDLIQTGLSLLDYLDDRDLIAWCGVNEIAVTIYEPVCNGILTDTPFDQVRARWVGSPWEDTSLFRRLFSPASGIRAEAVVEGLRHLAQETGATPAQLAIAWVLRQPGVTSAIAGSSSLLHTQENAAAGELSMDDATLEAMERLVPLGPAFA
jgi:aryl-alcohol dehydrogenase-like predicted oxidoreductase